MNMDNACFGQILSPSGWVACKSLANTDIAEKRRRLNQFLEAVLTIFSTIILQKKGVSLPPGWWGVPADCEVVNDYFHTLQEANWYYHRHRGDGRSAARFVYTHECTQNGSNLKVWWSGWATEGRWVQIEADDHMVCLSWDSATGRPSRFLIEAFQPLFREDISTLIDDWGDKVSHPARE